MSKANLHIIDISYFRDRLLSKAIQNKFMNKQKSRLDHMIHSQPFMAGFGSILDLSGNQAYQQLESFYKKDPKDAISSYWKSAGGYLNYSIQNSQKKPNTK